VTGGALPEPPGRPREVLDALTGIRGLAAFWVLAFHGRRLLFTLFPAAAVARRPLEAGFLGVDLFFALSGFILAHNYVGKLARPTPGSYREFLGLRLARVYPVHLFTTLLTVILVLGATSTGRIFGAPREHGTLDLLLNLLMMHDWVWADHLSWNGPSWSVSAEWFAYAWFPAAAPLLGRVRRPLAGWAGAAAAYAGMLAVLHHLSPGTMDVTSAGGLVRVAGGFSAGCFLSRVYRSGWGERLPWDALALTLGLAICASTTCWGAPPWLVPLFAVLVLALARARGPVARLLASAPLLYAGRVSYAMYLTHGLALAAFEKLVPAERLAPAGLLARLAAVAGAALCVGAAAHLTYTLIEEPGRLRLRRLLSGAGPGRAPRPVAQPAA
jgi:peptidoglycan/LPS O-acetylase OafA/YrhL